MNDIHWRPIEDLFELFMKGNETILVFSNDTVFMSNASHIENRNGEYEDRSIRQKVTHFAFFNTPE